MTQLISVFSEKKVKHSVCLPSILCDSKQLDQYSNFGVDAHINIGEKKIPITIHIAWFKHIFGIDTALTKICNRSRKLNSTLNCLKWH